jgi:hypothetical protein
MRRLCVAFIQFHRLSGAAFRRGLKDQLAREWRRSNKLI